LVEAYDRAVNSFKNSLKDRNNTESKQSKRQGPKGNKNSYKKKSKNHKNTKWKIGDKCRAIYYEDGLIYEGEIIDIQNDEKTCTVRFDYYENEEVVSFSDIFERIQNEQNTNGTKRKSQGPRKHEAARGVYHESTKESLQNSTIENEFKDVMSNHVLDDSTTDSPLTSWAIGDMCLAPNPQTGIDEEAVITVMESDSCILTFIKSNTKERLKLEALRARLSKKKNCQHTCKRHSNRYAEFGQYDRGLPPDFPEQGFSPSDFIPQFGPSIPPPPPPIGMPIDIDDENGSALASMLMSWYMVGYHTGYYQGIRSRSCNQRVPKQHNKTDPMEEYSDSSSKLDV